jgi:hypothetical protein
MNFLLSWGAISHSGTLFIYSYYFQLLTQDRTAVDSLRRVMLSTLAMQTETPVAHAQWVRIWVSILAQKVGGKTGFGFLIF